MMMPYTMRNILLSGGSLDIDLNKNILFPDTMADLARCARTGGGHVTFRNGVLFPHTMQRVAASGPGHVTFAT